MDHRKTMRGRRQSWFGAKQHVKAAMARPPFHLGVTIAARCLPASKVARLPAPAKVTEVVGRTSRGSQFVLLAPDRCEIAKELYWGNGRRPRPEDALALDIVVNLCAGADVFLDVGAYTGMFAVATASANPRLRVHAFEMVPAVAAALDANLARNRLAARVTVHRTAVGSLRRTVRVPSGEGGSALPSFLSTRMEFDDGVDVECRPLDDVLPSLRDGDEVVMKIDVEGAEPEVLESGSRLLSRYTPDILCEVLPGVGDGPALEQRLKPHGYSYYLVTDAGLEPRPGIVPDETFRDWLFTTKAPDRLCTVGVAVHLARDAA